ncbi:MAG: BTAD domain-containing putative transcriptional regulator [Pseudonocardia sp.]
MSEPARQLLPTAPDLVRGRLLELIGKPARLTLVVAPAGYGKTTLLAQHARACPTPVVWHRTGRLDVEPARLASGLARSLCGAGMPTPRTLDVQELVRAVDAAGLTRRTLLIDDAHLLLGAPSEEWLEDFLTRAPPSLSIVLASRRTPGVNLCRAELGTIALVTGEDLRFRSWEVESLFRDVYREPLPPDDIATLTRRTDGWAACLQLFHLSTRARGLADRRRAVGALSGAPRFARTYLAGTVLEEVPAGLRTFLARTAVFEALTAQRCDRLLNRTDSQARLVELEQLGVLSTAEDDGATLRCHEVLRRHLESVLFDELGAERTQAWYATAAVLLEEQAAPAEALSAYLRAERWEEAARLLRADGATVLAAGLGQSWHDLLPAPLVEEDPWLGMAFARRLAGQGRLVAASQEYRHAEALFPDPIDRYRAREERRLVELWTGGCPQPHVHWLDRLRAAVRRHPGAPPGAAVASTPGEQLCDAVTALLTGDVAAAGARLQTLLVEPGTDGALALAARLTQVVVDLAAGADVTASVDRLATDADRVGATWVARQARVLDGLRTRDGAQIRRVLAECEAVDDAWGALLARGADALRALLVDEPALRAWQELVEHCRTAGESTLEAWARVGAALAAAAEGAPRAVVQARSAESFVRASGVWGAQGLAVLALAAAGPASSRTGTAEQASSLARVHGLAWPAGLARRLLGADPVPHVEVVRELAAVQLRCLGGFTLHVGDRAVAWSTLRPRAAAALRLLAAHTPQLVHRETVLELWPDRSGDQATHGLQVAISSLRHLLAPDAPRGSGRMIERHGEAYALVLPPGSTADVATFRDGLRAADRARRCGDTDTEADALGVALVAYGGDLLPEDGPAEWVVELRDRLRLQAATGAGRLAELALARGDSATCIDAAQRGLAIDPFWDASWRALITAYDRTGDAAAAARTRRAYTDVLATLGVPCTG